MLIAEKRDELNEMNNCIVNNDDKLFKNDDEFTVYYTAKYIIQDTTIVIMDFMNSGFDGNGDYAKLLAVLNAVNIQQDCIKELFTIFVGSSFDRFEKDSAWKRIRDLRIRIAGHPINSGQGKGKPKFRSFASSNLMQGYIVQFEQYEIGTKNVTHPTEDLKCLINCYDVFGAEVFEEILKKIRPYYTPEEETGSTVTPEGQLILDNYLKTFENIKSKI